MSSTYLGLTDLVKINDKNAVDNGMSDLFDDAPLVKALAAEVASDGTFHKYLKQTTTATAGMRTINTGLDNTHSADTAVTVNLQIADGSFAVDKAAADGYVKGTEAFIQREARRKLRAVMFAAENQIVNGTVGGLSAGFSGFADTLTALSNAYVINAGGTTASTGSSVYLIRTNDLGTDCEVIIGPDGSIKVDETVVIRMDDGSGKYLPGYYTPIEAWMGLQLGAAFSVVRIANLTADSGKGLTDALIASALALFPASRQPNLIAMGRRSLSQLQKSRTSYSPTGNPAEIPNNAFNIPIIVTDACTITETLLS